MSEPVNEALKLFNAKKFATIDRIRHDGRLTASTRIIGAEIFALIDFRSGDAWPSVIYLAEKLTLTDRTIKRATAALKQAGYILVVKTGRNNRYQPVFEDAEKGTNCPLFETGQGTICPPSELDRGQKRPEQGTISSANRGQKVPPTSLRTTLGLDAEGAAGRVGAPDGAAASASGQAGDQLGGFAAALRQRLGDDAFVSWFGRAAFVSEQGDLLTLAAPANFVASHLKNFFGGTIVEVWQSRRPHIVRLEVIVAKALMPAPAPAAASLADRRQPVAADARWLVSDGIPLVSERLRVGADKADRIIVEWLKRCGRDATGLRRVLTDAAAHKLFGDDFANIIKQRTRSMLTADQAALPLSPVALKRSAS